MSIKDCLIEVKDAVKDFLNEQEANELLQKIKNKIDSKKAAKDIEIKELELAKEILDEDLKETLQQKLNKLYDKQKNIENFNYVVEDWSNDPIKGLKVLLVGTESYKFKSRYSVDNAQLDYQSYIGNFDMDIHNGKLLNALQSKPLHKTIVQEVMDNPFLNESKKVQGESYADAPLYGNKEAFEIAKIIKKHNDIVLRDKNELGAWISREPGYVFKQSYRIEQLLKAAGENIKNEELHKQSFINDFINAVNAERTFKGDNPRAFAESVWENILSGHSIKTIDQSNYIGTKNIAKKQSAERVIHFKDGASFYEFDKKYGQGDLEQSLLLGFEKAAQDNGLTRILGTNPEANLNTVIQMLRNHFGGEKARTLNFDAIKNEFYEVNGTTKVIAPTSFGSSLATVASITRSISNAGKLDKIFITSLGDVPSMFAEIKHQGMGALSFANTLFTELKRTSTPEELKQIMGPFALFTDSFKSQFLEHFTAKDTMAGKFTSYQTNVFKYTGFLGLMQRFKRSMVLAMQNHYGNLTDTPFKNLSDDTKRIFGYYGIDEGKWNMIRKTSLKDFEGRKYLTLENIDQIPKEEVIDYLKTTKPEFKSFSERQISLAKKEIQSAYRMLLIDRTLHGPIEPGARERAMLNRGTKRGSVEGELLRLMTNLKSYAVSVATKVLQREWSSYGPGTLYSRSLPSIANYLILTTITGYFVITAKDLLSGKEPADPLDKRTALRAFASGGGGAIYFDTLNAEFNRSNGGTVSTLLGPVYSDVSGFAKMLKDVYNGDFGKAGVKGMKLLEANTPIDAWMIKPIYDYYVGWQLKEMMDPGYFNRLQNNVRKNTGQEFFLKP